MGKLLTPVTLLSRSNNSQYLWQYINMLPNCMCGTGGYVMSTSFFGARFTKKSLGKFLRLSSVCPKFVLSCEVKTC